MSDHDFNWPGKQKGDPAGDRLLGFLTLDVQNSPEWVAEILAQIQLVKTGKIASWERHGNAYYLTINGDRATIEDSFDESSFSVSLDELESALTAWINHFSH